MSTETSTPTAPATRFFYHVMPLAEFYTLAKSQHVSLHYESLASRRNELWLTESVHREADSYIVQRQGSAPSRFARLQVSAAEYDRICSVLTSHHDQGNPPAESGAFNLKRAMRLRDLQRRSEGIIPDRLPPVDSSDSTLRVLSLAMAVSQPSADIELRPPEPDAEWFNRASGKVKMLIAKDAIQVAALIVNVAELAEAISKSVETQDARPAVENAVKLATT